MNAILAFCFGKTMSKQDALHIIRVNGFTPESLLEYLLKVPKDERFIVLDGNWRFTVKGIKHFHLMAETKTMMEPIEIHYLYDP